MSYQENDWRDLSQQVNQGIESNVKYKTTYCATLGVRVKKF